MSVVAIHKTGNYAVTRYSPGSYTDGLWVEGGTSTLNLDCAVQPVRGKALENLPEGKHASDLRRVYCDTELLTASEELSTSADRIAISGDVYEIVESEQWVSGATGRAYWKALAARVVES